MTAMVCDGPGQPLRAEQRALPVPGAGEVLVRVLACGVCRTDLHVVDGDIPASYPIVPGHEIVGQVLAIGRDVEGFAIGDRIGIPWLGQVCNTCTYCREGRENLCDHPQFTGATRDGGYASHALADARFCFPIPAGLSDLEAAPLLCAGLIGWRAYRMAGKGRRLGLYGFGAAAHILAQLAVAEGREIYAFTRKGDHSGQDFARSLGCVWAGDSDDRPSVELDAAILFAPVGALVPAALKAVRKGGRVVCAGIHMSDIPSFAYADLWGERSILSVANLTREDGRSFLAQDLAARVKSHVVRFALSDANEALNQLRAGAFEGAAVLVP
ncbi:MAG: zinc-dependent alcohol dehydrogenase family protein [Novosphingobium sp.]|nr:zinc-dependent alcohol dehydrogenase family protein [Novosphingobium sp.]